MFVSRSAPAIPPHHLHRFHQYAAQLHYALEKAPLAGTSKHERFVRDYRNNVVKLASLLSKYDSSITELPTTALGAIYEYNRSKRGDPPPLFDLSAIQPVRGTEVPPRYAAEKLAISGDDQGLIRLLDAAEVEKRWWEEEGTYTDTLLSYVSAADHPLCRTRRHSR